MMFVAVQKNKAFSSVPSGRGKWILFWLRRLYSTRMKTTSQVSVLTATSPLLTLIAAISCTLLWFPSIVIPSF